MAGALFDGAGDAGRLRCWLGPKRCTQVLADRLGWDTLTDTVEQVYDALSPAQRAQACVLASNDGEAGALSQLAAPGELPPIISGHNNYSLWGSGTCTGQVLIVVGFAASDLQEASIYYTHIALVVTQECSYCVFFECRVPIYILSGATRPIFPQLWSSLKHFD